MYIPSQTLMGMHVQGPSSPCALAHAGTPRWPLLSDLVLACDSDNYLAKENYFTEPRDTRGIIIPLRAKTPNTKPTCVRAARRCDAVSSSAAASASACVPLAFSSSTAHHAASLY